MTTINQSCPVAKQPSDLDSELAKLTGNLQQVQDTFLNHWTGDQLTKFLQDHLREHETLIQESKDQILCIQKELKILEQQSLSNKEVGEDNKKKLLALKAVIKESALKLQELLFEREQKQKEYIVGMEKCNQQKELVEAQEKATKTRLRELIKAESLYKEWLGLQFKKISEDHLQFVFSYLDPKDHSRTFSFTIKIENNKYNVADSNPAIEGLDKMAASLNESNNLTEFIVTAWRKFKELL
ncbi:kinetochore protein Spc25-like [Asterias rubens]|uniref:kinetochore protein Spc25-like n=1 Tax=Asterias rubens TaxID=7604 RepID=UPI001455A0E2|nr:kinetochore protein Spc25-like [Asterias rubens]